MTAPRPEPDAPAALPREQEQDKESRVADTQYQPPLATAAENKPEPTIKNGIEFFSVGDDDDCQCARCGASCFFVDCDNCGGEGEIEDDDWQCEGEYYRCDWCRGAGGWWRCLSSEAWCSANPMPGREDQPVMGCKPGERFD